MENLKFKNSETKAQEIYARLMRERIVFLGQALNDDLANLIIAQMLYLESEAPGKPIYLYLNTPGGSVSSTLAILDVMEQIQSDVVTVCIGLAAGAGSLLLAAGTKGKRLALSRARIMMTRPSSSIPVDQSAKDIETLAKEILQVRDEIFKLYATHTGQPLAKIIKDTEREFFLSADEAKEYGLIDRIIERL